MSTQTEPTGGPQGELIKFSVKAMFQQPVAKPPAGRAGIGGGKQG